MVAIGSPMRSQFEVREHYFGSILYKIYPRRRKHDAGFHCKALQDMAHDIVHEAPDNGFGFGGAQIISRHGDGNIAGSDHLKDACTVGF